VSAQEQAKRPNLLFILTEGQRWDALSLTGNRVVKTPYQDRIGREGVVFKNSFCTNALCAPSRAVALTGKYSHTTGAMGNNTRDPLPANLSFVTDLLRQSGYDVALCGKAHVGNGARERYWDYYFGFNGAVTNYYRPRFYEGRKGEIGEEKTYSGFADDIITDRAVAWLREPRERPFCLLLWLQTPHAPFFRPRKYLRMYEGQSMPVPATFDDDLKGYPGKPRGFVNAAQKIGTVDNGDAARAPEGLMKDYYAGVVSLDDNIGRVMNLLEESGRLDETAILHASDHGFFLGEFRCFDKRFMHEPSIRVPTMLRYPKACKPGTQVDGMILNVDYAPTLLELAGVPVPDDMQGRSLGPFLKGQSVPDWRKSWYYEYDDNLVMNVPASRGIRTERYKFIQYYKETPQEFELYDLQEDPGELRNLADDRARQTLRLELEKQMAELRRQLGDTWET
jgi:arylsulfatase A-like enzyme